MITASVIGLSGGLIGIIMDFDVEICTYILVGVFTVHTELLFMAVILTEAGLHRRFDKNGNPR